MNYFSNCRNPDEVRSIYRQLVKVHHPDLGGDTRTMQEINAAYEQVLRSMNGKTFYRTSSGAGTGETAEKWEYHYSAEREQEIAEAIARVMRIIGNATDTNAYIVGLWIWVVGNTRPYRQELKVAGFWWNQKRSAWTWKPAGTRSRYNPRKTLEDILSEGVRVKTEQREQRTSLAA